MNDIYVMTHQGALVKVKTLQHELERIQRIGQGDYPDIPVTREGKIDPISFKERRSTFMMLAQQHKVNDIFDANILPPHTTNRHPLQTDQRYIN